METEEKTEASELAMAVAEDANAPAVIQVQQCEKCDKAAVPPTPVREVRVDRGEDDKADPVELVIDRPEVRGFCEKHGGAAIAPFTRTAEEWAALRGHLPEFFPGEKPKGKDGKPNKDAIVPPVHNPKVRFYNEPRFLLWGGVIGREMTLAEYDAGTEAACNHVFR